MGVIDSSYEMTPQEEEEYRVAQQRSADLADGPTLGQQERGMATGFRRVNPWASQDVQPVSEVPSGLPGTETDD
jgi:hypothetical protein